MMKHFSKSLEVAEHDHTQKFLILFITVLFLSMFIILWPGFAVADTQDRLPTSDLLVQWDTLNPTSPTTHYDKVDDPIGAPDNNTSYIENISTNNALDIFSFSAFTVPAGATVNSVSVTFVAADSTAGGPNSMEAAIRVGASDYSGTQNYNPSNTQPSYDPPNSFSWTTNPATSAAWTVNDVNGVGADPLQGFGVVVEDHNPDLRVTQVYVTVDYTPAAAATQELDTFTDDSADVTVPVTNHPMATIGSSATGGGASLTSTRVSVGGTVAAADVASIRVLWNSSEVGIVNNPVSLTDVDVTLTGAGSGTGNLAYQISLNASAAGKTFNLTVTSVTGVTADNIPLPQTTATRNASAAVATQELDTFTDTSSDTAAPVTNRPMATIGSSATGGGASLTSTRVSVGGTVAAADVASIRVLWNSSEVGIVNNPVSLTDVDVTLTGAGSGTGNLAYQISLNASAVGKTFNLTVTSVTGATADNIPLPQTTATRNATVATGDGNLLKRSVEETCHGCHKTDLNFPADPDAIKMHNSTNLSSTKWAPAGWGITGGKYGEFKCTTCHTPHDSANIYLIGETITTPDGSNFQGRATNSVSVDFRVKSGTPANPGPQTSGIMGDDSVTHSTSVFICEVCHTYDATKANGVDKHAYSMTVTADHNNAVDCTTCHSHKTAFAGAGACTDCHSERRGSIPRAQIIGGTLGSEGDDFIRPSRHVKNAAVTDFDCIVCHTEGDAVNSTGTDIKTDTAKHGGDGGSTTVDLRNVDNYTTVIAAWPGQRLGSPTITSTDRDNMDSFCMGCHDSDTSSSVSNRGGAWDISVNSADNGLDTGGPVGRRTTPFNTADGGSPRDVRGQFNYQSLVGKLWASHHNLNQFTLRYDATYAASVTSAGFTGTSVDGVAVDWDTGFHCADCHLNEANAHGARNTNRAMLQNSSGADASWTNAADGTATFVCYKCHRNDVYNRTGTPVTGVARLYHGTLDIEAWDLDAVYPDQRQIVCLNCHGGGSTLGDAGIGGIHGKNFTYTTLNNGDTKSYRFMNGNELWYDISEANWETTAQPACYTDSSSGWGTCNHHDGRESTGRIDAPGFSRPLE